MKPAKVFGQAGSASKPGIHSEGTEKARILPRSKTTRKHQPFGLSRAGAALAYAPQQFRKDREARLSKSVPFGRYTCIPRLRF